MMPVLMVVLVAAVVYGGHIVNMHSTGFIITTASSLSLE